MRTSTTFRSGHPKLGGRRKGIPNRATAEIRELAQLLTLGNPRVVERLRLRHQRGEFEPSVFRELLHYAYGKPAERIQDSDLQDRDAEWDSDKLTEEELETLLALLRKSRVTEPAAEGSAA